jgi:hypothetical protein
VSVLAVTVNNVTTYCVGGVCPGYARRRRLLGVGGGVVVIVGIVTQTPIVDVSESIDALPGVESSSVLPNSPVANLTSIAGDSRKLIQQVQVGFTVYVIVHVETAAVNYTPVVVGVAAVVVVVAVLAVIALRMRPKVLVTGTAATGAESQFTTDSSALQSIRITKENYKPYIKTV